MTRQVTVASQVLVTAVLFIASCSSPDDIVATSTSSLGLVSSSTVLQQPTTTPATTTTFSAEIPDAEAYVLEAFDVVEANALFADSIDWVRQRQEARQFVAEHATRTQDLYGLIQLLLLDLGDRHSHFYDPDEMSQLFGDSHDNSPPDIEQREGSIGYVGLKSFRGVFGVEEYLNVSHAGIAELDQAGTCGWIVDLRDERGGSMWVPLTGIGLLLGVSESDDDEDNVVGYFVDFAGDMVPWRYEDGVAYIDSDPQATIAEPYRLLDPAAPVAVILGPRTASAGEAIAVAFQGRPNTRSFGDPTFGVPTGNEVFTLTDGAGIALTMAQFVDRTGQMYGPVGGLIPDQAGGDTEAIAWLLSQPACT